MSREAEVELIGKVLIDFGRIGEVVNILSPEMFQDSLLGWIYSECVKSFDAGVELSHVEILQLLEGRGHAPSVAREIVRECMETPYTGISIKTYANALRNDYRARRMGDILNATRPTGGDIDKCIRDTIASLESLIVENTEKEKTLKEITEENKDNYFKPSDTKRVTLGFDNLDKSTGGIEGGDVVLIAARPAVGKSALAMQIMRNMANDGLKIAYFNLEMREKQIYERLAAAISGIDLNRIRLATNYLNDEKQKFDEANEKLEKHENIVIHSGSKRVNDIRAEIKDKGYDVVIIDYLQLLKSDTKRGANRYAEVGDISRGIKSIAMDFKIPLIALSQLNRSTAGKEDKEPLMSDLRESGDLEQDASVILMLWNTDKDDSRKKMIKVEKARQGTTARQELIFDGKHMTFDTDTFVDADDYDLPFI